MSMPVTTSRHRDAPHTEELGAPTSPLDPLMRWAPVLLVAVAPVFWVLRLTRPVSDPDTFWHLHAGQQLWSTWQFAGPEPWSEFSSRPWVLHEWLPELGYALAFHLGGFTALAGVQSLTAAALLGVLYLCCRRHGAALPAAAVAAVAWLGCTGSLAARPQMATFVLLAVFASAWLGTVRDGRPRWWLVPLTFVWACSHGLWVAGVMTGAAVVLGLAIDRRLDRRQLVRLALVPALGLVVAALTPVGPRLLLTPLGVRGYAGYVTEWRSAALTDVYLCATVGLAVLCVLVWATRRPRVSTAHLLLWLLGLLWALLYARTVALGAVTLAPLATEALHRCLPARTGVRRRHELLALGCGALLAVLATTAVAPAAGRASSSAVLGDLDRLLAPLPTGTVVFNEYGTGGWLMLTHPNLSPVVDERTEVYSLQHLDAYATALRVRRGWQDSVRGTGATTAVLTADSPLAVALTDQWHWREAGRDRGFVLLVSGGTTGPASPPSP